MDNMDKLIEKYKKDMIGYSRRSLYPVREETDEINESAPVVLPANEKKQQEEAAQSKEAVTAATDNSEPAQKEPVQPNKNEHFGFLKVSVFAGNEAFPIETARVEVFDKNGELLYSLLTNSGGIAENMKLPAPDKIENDAPGGKDGFSVYSVKVSHPDYETQKYDNVQIFDGIESIQPVFLRVEETPIKNSVGEEQ